MKIDIPYEVADAIVIASLKDQLKCFEDYLKSNKENQDCCKVFETDRLEDRKLIKKHINACKRLIEWYGGAIE